VDCPVTLTCDAKPDTESCMRSKAPMCWLSKAPARQRSAPVLLVTGFAIYSGSSTCSPFAGTGSLHVAGEFWNTEG